MSTPEIPQVYLITPPAFELSRFPSLLEQVLEAHPVACVRLALAGDDASAIARAADACREVTHARDVALVIEQHLHLAERLGLDGVHISSGSAKAVREARKALGEDAIVGVHAGTSRHDGLNAGEAGADYVAFGPVTPSDLGDGRHAEDDLFAWWSEMIELPVVAEGGLTAGRIAALASVTDFFGIGPEIWSEDDPGAALASLMAGLG